MDLLRANARHRKRRLRCLYRCNVTRCYYRNGMFNGVKRKRRAVDIISPLLLHISIFAALFACTSRFLPLFACPRSAAVLPRRCALRRCGFNNICGDAAA
jgi:hypothetical protein